MEDLLNKKFKKEKKEMLDETAKREETFKDKTEHLAKTLKDQIKKYKDRSTKLQTDCKAMRDDFDQIIK